MTWKKLAFFWSALICSFAIAGGIKTWSSNEIVTNTDLNANFQHLHSNLGHNHGAVIVNADISPTAAVSHSKLATPSLLPKLWAQVSPGCTASPCTLASSQGVTSITRTGAGSYVVNFPARTNAAYAVFLSSGLGDISCRYGANTTTTVAVICFTTSTLAATDAEFSVMVMDNN